MMVSRSNDGNMCKVKQNNLVLVPYEQVSVSSGIGRTEGLEFEMPLKW